MRPRIGSGGGCRLEKVSNVNRGQSAGGVVVALFQVVLDRTGTQSGRKGPDKGPAVVFG
jgi:hypothetical protein